MADVIAYLALGALVGTLAGLLGIGGGLVIVAVLVHLFSAQGIGNGLTMHMAIGTSQATIVMTSIAAIWAHHRQRGVLWPIMAAMASGIVLGALLGAVIAEALSGQVLKGLFGSFALLIAWRMGVDIHPAAVHSLPRRWILALMGALIGTVSALFGIGGGSLTVPYLVWHSIPMRNAVGTASACGFPLAVSGTCGFVWMGWDKLGLPAWSSGYVYWPAAVSIVATSMLFAPLGARLAHRLASITLKRIFAIFLGGLGLEMLLELTGAASFLFSGR
ncbi:sulfite exporter TauE/SafE family protein [Nitrosococcus watsonii]|uniref:Probable membrane transporter protein n=1 Tax=Nitrosococcus watsoni (strain C-113) TaxID=105559 RepID=D8KB45_NITWC|nr:sulfite exporter TauE/SafE family protein [Nitrosococcus watsonii]ADJ27579.1 protein of unknown function DUF81 [Nitrosococcus watsonii C-113]